MVRNTWKRVQKLITSTMTGNYYYGSQQELTGGRLIEDDVHVLMVHTLRGDFLRIVSSAIDTLATNRILFHVDPKAKEINFLLNLTITDTENTHKLKTVWKDGLGQNNALCGSHVTWNTAMPPPPPRSI